MAAGIYLHIPFCKSRCSYCDFATDVYRSGEAVERYVAALVTEIGSSIVDREVEFQASTSSIDTIYFGGGTPSLLLPQQVKAILNAIKLNFESASDLEITMEMNPGTVTVEKLDQYRNLGVNRASFGVQTFNERDLKLLARGHDANDARATYRMLRDAGFENISFDLIAGLPGQSLDDWSQNLDEAIAMSPEHLSLYLLEIHEATPLAEQVSSGRRPLPDPELAAEMYELMLDRLAAAGYQQYEISNFAKPGFESRHNNKYWRLEPVFGFGVSAHSFDGRERFANERDTNAYVRLIEDVGAAETFRETANLAAEFLYLGLRLNEGIDVEEYQSRFGGNMDQTIERLSEDGLVSLTNGRLRLTRKGMLYSNEVFAEFV
jgi:oxygen-independent coproporphyrinogen-3 oxidase